MFRFIAQVISFYVNISFHVLKLLWIITMEFFITNFHISELKWKICWRHWSIFWICVNTRPNCSKIYVKGHSFWIEKSKLRIVKKKKREMEKKYEGHEAVIFKIKSSKSLFVLFVTGNSCTLELVIFVFH